MNTILILSLLVLGLIAWATSRHWYLSVVAKPAKAWITILAILAIWGTAFWVVNHESKPQTTKVAEMSQDVTVASDSQDVVKVIPVIPNLSPTKNDPINFKKYAIWCLSVVGLLVIWLTRKWSGPWIKTKARRAWATKRDWLAFVIIAGILAGLIWFSVNYALKADRGVGKEVPAQVVTSSTTTTTVVPQANAASHIEWIQTTTSWMSEHWIPLVMVAGFIILVFMAVRTGKVKTTGANVWEFLMLLILCIVILRFIDWGRTGAGNTHATFTEVTATMQPVPPDTTIAVTDKGWTECYPIKRGLCYLSWETASPGFIVTECYIMDDGSKRFTTFDSDDGRLPPMPAGAKETQFMVVGVKQNAPPSSPCAIRLKWRPF